MKRFKARGIKVIIYEPTLAQSHFFNLQVFSDLNNFKLRSAIVITNQVYDEIRVVASKVFTHDLFGLD